MENILFITIPDTTGVTMSCSRPELYCMINKTYALLAKVRLTGSHKIWYLKYLIKVGRDIKNICILLMPKVEHSGDRVAGKVRCTCCLLIITERVQAR